MVSHKARTRIRIAGSKENCERILSLLRTEAKLFKTRRFNRGDKNQYSRIFGNSDTVIYVRAQLPIYKEIERESLHTHTKRMPQDLCPHGFAWCIGDCDFGQDCDDCDKKRKENHEAKSDD